MSTTVQNPFQNASTPTSSQQLQTMNPTAGMTPTTQTNAFTSTVDKPTETVQGQLDSILAKDSPLMQRARTLATQQMGQRGLINSSMAQGAGVTAMVDAATPIAAQDAQTYGQRNMFNTDARNQNAQFNTGQNNDLYKFGQGIAANFGLQQGQQTFEAGQRAMDRQFQTSERLGTQQFQTGERLGSQDFDLTKLSAQQRNQLEQMAVSQGYNLQSMNQQQINELAKMQLGQQFNLDTIGAQAQAELGKLSVQQQYNVLNMATQQGYDLTKLDAQQVNQLQQMSVQQQYAMQQLGSQQTFQARMASLEQDGLDFRQAREIASREMLTQLELAGVNNRFDQELALKAEQFNVEQYNLERRQILDNQAQLERLGLQINANNQSIPTSFAANISSTAMSGINAIMADPNISTAAKQTAINNVVSYANAQISWAEKFYSVAIPRLSGITAT
jgi:hypothetical protein